MFKDRPVVVVLGGGINLDGTLSAELIERVDLAIELYRSHQVKTLIMCGAYSYKATEIPKLTEAQAMSNYAASLGVSTKDIFVEDKSKDTIGNAYYSKILFLEPHNWHHLIIVASPNHSHQRIEYIFKKILGDGYGFNIIPSEENNHPSNIECETKSLNLARDWLSAIKDGDDKGVYEVMVSNHPAWGQHSKYTVKQLIEILE